MFDIKRISALPIEGETCSSKYSYGVGEMYSIFSQDPSFIVQLRYETWNTGERNINCIEASGHPFLSTVVGRMRLVIEPYDEQWDFITFKTAMLRSESPPHANLYNKDPDYYQKALDINLRQYFANITSMRFGSKEELLNRTGRERNEYCMVFPNGDHITPLTGFVLSRVLPIILSKQA